MILSDFHSNSLSEPSQSVDMTLLWPTWWAVADMEVDMVADIDTNIGIAINMEIQFGERVG